MGPQPFRQYDRAVPPPHNPAMLLAATCGVIAVAGCGRAVTVGAGRTLRVAVTEYRVRPDDVTSPAGSLTIVAHNYGRLTHNLAVTQGSTTIGHTPPIPPGGSATLTVTVARGTYTVTSTMLSDQALGTYGTLHVK